MVGRRPAPRRSREEPTVQAAAGCVHRYLGCRFGNLVTPSGQPGTCGPVGLARMLAYDGASSRSCRGCAMRPTGSWTPVSSPPRPARTTDARTRRLDVARDLVEGRTPDAAAMAMLDANRSEARDAQAATVDLPVRDIPAWRGHPRPGRDIDRVAQPGYVEPEVAGPTDRALTRRHVLAAGRRRAGDRSPDNRVGAGVTPAPPTPPDVRVRIRRFASAPGRRCTRSLSRYQAEVGPVAVGQGPWSGWATPRPASSPPGVRPLMGLAGRDTEGDEVAPASRRIASIPSSGPAATAVGATRRARRTPRASRPARSRRPSQRGTGRGRASRTGIAMLQRREVRRRSRAFRRCFALRSSLTLTLPSRLKKPKPRRPRRVAGATPLFSRFTLSLSRPSTKVGDALEDASRRPFAGHVDPQVVGIADEGVAPPLQLVVEVVEHDVGQQRREGDPCGVPSAVATFTPSTMTPASR